MTLQKKYQTFIVMVISIKESIRARHVKFCTDVSHMHLKILYEPQSYVLNLRFTTFGLLTSHLNM
jgi:hypothetical protein